MHPAVASSGDAWESTLIILSFHTIAQHSIPFLIYHVITFHTKRVRCRRSLSSPSDVRSRTNDRGCRFKCVALGAMVVCDAMISWLYALCVDMPCLAIPCLLMPFFLCHVFLCHPTISHAAAMSCTRHLRYHQIQAVLLNVASRVAWHGVPYYSVSQEVTIS